MFYSDGFEEGLAIISKVHPLPPPSLPSHRLHNRQQNKIIHSRGVSHVCAQRPVTDVAVFLLPSFDGAGDDHQRALLHAVSEAIGVRVSQLHERLALGLAGCSWCLRWN